MIYLQETIAIDRGGKEAYLELLGSRLAPYLERSRGMRLVWMGSTIGSTARWPETTAIFELRDWGHWADVCGRMYTESTPDAELAELWREALPHRLRSRSRTLVPAAFSPSLDDLRASGVAGTAFAFSSYRVAPGGHERFFASLEGALAGEADRGRRLVGAYEVAFTNDEAVAVWAHRALADLTAYESRREAPRLDAVVEWTEHWGFATPGSPLWPADYATSVKVW